MMLFRDSERDFPAPYRFVDSSAMHIGPDGTPMNRAKRRRAKREARKYAKKPKKR